MADEPLIETPGTYADESYSDDATRDQVTVFADFSGHVDLTWYVALMWQMKQREVKYAEFKRAEASLPPALVRQVYGGLRAAKITIVDDRSDRLMILSSLENIVGQKIEKLEPKGRRQAESAVDQSLNRLVLAKSPAIHIASLLDEGNVAQVLDQWAGRLKKAHNVRILAGRLSSTFPEAIDPFDTSVNGPVWRTGDDPIRAALRRSLPPPRTFDKGNTLVTDLIRGIRSRVDAAVANLDGGPPVEQAGLVAEADSNESPYVGASDIASNHARHLYQSDDGISKVRDAFDYVVLNGEVLRR